MMGSMSRFIRNHVTHSSPPLSQIPLVEAMREFVDQHITGQEHDDLRRLLGSPSHAHA